MAADLFAAPARDTRVRSRQSSLVVVSVVAHVALVVALIVISFVLPDVLPAPHTAALAWDAGPQRVRLVDIPLPPPPPARTTVAPAPAAADAAPVVAPEGIAPEPDRGGPIVQPGTELQAGLLPGSVTGAGLAVPPPPPPPPPPSQPVRLHAGIDAPRRVKEVTPVYPALARSAGAQGVVIIEAIIDVNGDVVSAKILRSVPLLDAAAVDAVRQWKYTPARLNGEPVPVVVTVTVNFTLGR